jgi:hypothetical protein
VGTMDSHPGRRSGPRRNCLRQSVAFVTLTVLIAPSLLIPRFHIASPAELVQSHELKDAPLPASKLIGWAPVGSSPLLTDQADDDLDEEVAAWCQWNDQFNQQVAVGTAPPLLWSQPELLHLAVTVAASDLDSVRWLGDVPFPTSLFVKDDYGLTSFRSHLSELPQNLTGSALLNACGGDGERASELVTRLTADDEEARGLPLPAVQCAAAVIRRHYAAAWGLRRNNTQTAGDRDRPHDPDRSTRRRAARVDMIRSVRRARFGSRAGAIRLLERPNVGDEAASIAEVLAEAHRGGVSATSTIFGPAAFFAFVHAHRDSWHSVDVVHQLRCLRLDSGRRYVTLTSASRAFLLQPQPVPLVASRASAGAGGGGDAALVVMPDLWEPRDRRGHVAAPVPPRPVPPQLLRFRAAARLREAATLWNHREAARLLQPNSALPTAFVRDCCSSFVVSVAALNGVDSAVDFDHVLRLLRRQPIVPASPETEAAAAVQQRSNAPPPPFEELSMYAERLWRLIFQPSAADVARDVTVVGCQGEPSLLDRVERRLRIVNMSQPARRGVGDVANEAHRLVIKHETLCAPYSGQNRFGDA